MSRDLPAGLETAIDEPVVRPFIAVRVELPDPVYAWTGRGNLIFNDASSTSRTWLGVGGLAALDTIGEATDGSATGMKASLFNIPSEFRADIADQAVRGVTFEIYVGALNETFQTVDGVQRVWAGKLDEYKITDAGDTITVEISGESRAIDQRRPAIKRFTNEYQQRKYPGDTFFARVSKMTEISILWDKHETGGVASVGVGAGGAGGSLGDAAARASL